MEKVTNKNTDVNPYFFRHSGSIIRQSSPKTPFLVHNPEPFPNKSRTKLEQNPLKTPLPKPHNKTHCNNVTNKIKCLPRLQDYPNPSPDPSGNKCHAERSEASLEASALSPETSPDPSGASL